MQILVTGGAGFVGSRLTGLLADRGEHSVFIVDVRFDERSGFPGAAVDIVDKDALRQVFQAVRPAFVYHLAGVADARLVLSDPHLATTVNVAGTAAVLDAAASTGVTSVVVASSAWVDSALTAPPSIAAPFRATGGGHVYTTTMIARELLAHDFWSLHRQRFTILRYSPLYGPGMWPGLAVRSFLEAAARGGPLVVHGDGSTSRRFLHVDDLTDALVRCMSEKAANETFAIRGPESTPVRELARMVSELFGGVEVQFRPASERRGQLANEDTTSKEDAEKVRALLGWEPGITLRDGLAALVDEYRPDRR